jgi:hypothetical protein
LHRTQISLTDEQYQRLRDESIETGRSLAALIRLALDERYGGVSHPQRLALLDDAFGAWSGKREGGAEFVERVRTGTARRLGRARR